jgi:hypothetical protein
MPMGRGAVSSVFRTKDGRTIILRPLKRGDLDALVPFANSFVKERKRNRELGITSMEKRMTRADEKAFLDKTLEGWRREGVSASQHFTTTGWSGTVI